MEVKSLVMFELGPMNTQKRRSMTLDVDSMLSLETFINSTNHGEATSPAAINRLAAGVMSYNNTPEDAGAIEGGWGERRFTFILAVSRTMAMSGNTRQVDYITGYTDMAVDLLTFSTKTPDLPSDMMFHITRVLSVNEVTSIDPVFGREKITAYPIKMTDMLTGEYTPFAPGNEQTIRVQDAMTYSNTVRWLGKDVGTGTVAPEITDLAKSFHGNVDGSVTSPNRVPKTHNAGRGQPAADNLLTFATEVLKPADISTNVPSMYLKKAFESMNTVRTSYENGAYSANVSDDAIYNETIELVSEPAVNVNPTIRDLSRNNNGFGFKGVVSWNELKEKFGSRIRQVLDIFPAKQVEKQKAEFGFNPLDSQAWDVVDYPTIYANSLIVQLISMMTYRLIESFKFVADNYGRPNEGILPGEWVVGLKSVVPYIPGYDSNVCARQIRSDMLSNILPGVAKNHGSRIAFSGGINIMLDGQLYVTVDDGMKTPYTLANFKPAAVSPLISRNAHEVYRLASGLCNLADAVTDKGNY